MKNNKLSIRLTDNQMLVLGELSRKLHCGYSVIIRAIVLDFLTKYEDEIERLIENGAPNIFDRMDADN